MSVRPGRQRALVALLLAGLGAVTLLLLTRRVTPPPRAGVPPMQPPSAQAPAAPSAEAEGHPVFEYPVPPTVLRPPAPPPTPAVSAAPATGGQTERFQRPPNRPATTPSAPAPGGRLREVAPKEGRSTAPSPTQEIAPAAVTPPEALPTVTGEAPSGGSTPAAATPPEAGTGSAPILRPPVPLEQPPLHPVLRATITSGPGGGSAVEEATVRGRVRIRLLVRSDGTVASAEVVVSSGDAALDGAARLGPLRWRFAPATRDGVPIDAYLLLWITFSG